MELFIICGIIIALLLMNFYFKYQTYHSVDKEIQEMEWNIVFLEEYVKNSYHLVAERFSKVNLCWLKYPWRNMFYKNLWKMKGKGLPCSIQTFLFHRLVQRRLDQKNVRTKVISSLRKKVIIHFYSNIKLNGKWVDVDVWGKQWGVPFGKNVKNHNWDYN